MLPGYLCEQQLFSGILENYFIVKVQEKEYRQNKRQIKWIVLNCQIQKQLELILTTAAVLKCLRRRDSCWPMELQKLLQAPQHQPLIVLYMSRLCYLIFWAFFGQAEFRWFWKVYNGPSVPIFEHIFSLSILSLLLFVSLPPSQDHCISRGRRS